MAATAANPGEQRGAVRAEGSCGLGGGWERERRSLGGGGWRVEVGLWGGWQLLWEGRGGGDGPGGVLCEGRGLPEGKGLRAAWGAVWGGEGCCPIGGPGGVSVRKGARVGGGSSEVGLVEQSVVLGRNEGIWGRGGVCGGVVPLWGAVLPRSARAVLLPAALYGFCCFPPFFSWRFFLPPIAARPAAGMEELFQIPSEPVGEPGCDACRRHRAQPILPCGRWPSGSPYLGSWLSLAAC